MRRYLIFITVSLPLLLFSISGTSVAVAFPNIITGLNTSLVIAGWIMIAFQLATIVLLPVTGEIINFFGKRFTLLLSMVVFTVGSALCAIAPNIYMLIAFRIIQAVGGVPIMPCVTSIVSDTFPETRQRAIGLLSSIFPIGMIIGPNLGGW
jgi:MFS family permease